MVRWPTIRSICALWRLSPRSCANCRRTIGVAAGPEKVRPIRAALAGRYLDSLVLDEETAQAVLETMEGLRDVA